MAASVIVGKVTTTLLQAHLEQMVKQLGEGDSDNIGCKASQKLFSAGNTVLKLGLATTGEIPPAYAATAAGLALVGHTIFAIGSAVKDYNTIITLQRDYGEFKQSLQTSQTFLKGKLKGIEDQVNNIEEIIEKEVCPLFYLPEQRRTEPFLKLAGRLRWRLHLVEVDIDECVREADRVKTTVDQYVQIVKNARSTPVDQLVNTGYGMGVSSATLAFAVNPLVGLIGGLVSGLTLLIALGNAAEVESVKATITRELASIEIEIRNLQNRLDDVKKRIEKHTELLKQFAIVD